MNRRSIGRLHRTIRVRLGVRQADVSNASGVSRHKISRLERDLLAELPWGDVERSFAALGVRASIQVSWNGAELDRLLDEGHARLVGVVVELLHHYGWRTKPEVTFSVYGERGSIDILAWHPAERVLLVVEIKTELASVEGLLRTLDVKVRLAPQIAP